MVAAQDLKSCDFGHAGSSPALGTNAKTLFPRLLKSKRVFVFGSKALQFRQASQTKKLVFLFGSALEIVI